MTLQYYRVLKLQKSIFRAWITLHRKCECDHRSLPYLPYSPPCSETNFMDRQLNKCIHVHYMIIYKCRSSQNLYCCNLFCLVKLCAILKFERLFVRYAGYMFIYFVISLSHLSFALCPLISGQGYYDNMKLIFIEFQTVMIWYINPHIRGRLVIFVNNPTLCQIPLFGSLGCRMTCTYWTLFLWKCPIN